MLDASEARINLDLEIGVDVQAYDATYLVDADIGSTVQAYDATYLVDADIGSTVQAYDATYVVDADIGSTVQGYNVDTLFANASDNLSVGYTTDIETLVSDTITPDLTTEWLKYREVVGTVTINEPTDGAYGGCVILLNVTGAGPYTVTLGAGCYPVGTIPDLLTTIKYECRIVKHTALITSVEIVEVVGA